MYGHGVRNGSPAKGKKQSRPINHGAGELCLNHHVAIDQGLSQHFKIPVSVLQNLDFNSELIAGDDRQPKTALVYPREIHQFRIPVRVPTKKEDNPHLGQGFYKKHPRHDWMIREVALEKRLIDSDILEPHHVRQTISLEDSVYQEEWVALREDLENLINFVT